MIRKADITDVKQVSEMMMDMTMEVSPEYASHNILDYRQETLNHLTRETDQIYVEDDKGFFVVRDEVECTTPTLHRIVGMKVYIKPEHRNGFLLANFYKKLFEDYPNGDIMGVTEIASKHIPVLDKRHDHIANVYRLRRS